MKQIVKIGYILLSFLFLMYLVYPSKGFPLPPDDSIQSGEPADTENPSRRAYFTDYTREEVLNFYREQIKLNIPNPLLLRLNYPPEDSQTIIRDQTRSTFLEELTYPMRESLYINGFEPKDPKDEIWYKGRHFRQKITVKYVANNPLIRVLVASGILTLGWFLGKQYLEGL